MTPDPLPLRCPSCDADMVGVQDTTTDGVLIARTWLRWTPLYDSPSASGKHVAWKCPECWHFERPRERGDG